MRCVRIAIWTCVWVPVAVGVGVRDLRLRRQPRRRSLTLYVRPPRWSARTASPPPRCHSICSCRFYASGVCCQTRTEIGHTCCHSVIWQTTQSVCAEHGVYLLFCVLNRLLPSAERTQGLPDLGRVLQTAVFQVLRSVVADSEWRDLSEIARTSVARTPGTSRVATEILLRFQTLSATMT